MAFEKIIRLVNNIRFYKKKIREFQKKLKKEEEELEKLEKNNGF